jgi:hypothetical protein
LAGEHHLGERVVTQIPPVGVFPLRSNGKSDAKPDGTSFVTKKFLKWGLLKNLPLAGC